MTQEVEERIVSLEKKVNHLIESRLDTENEKLKNKKSVVIWIDGPNFGRLSGEMNIIMPISELVRIIRENLGNVIFKSVFQSSRCHEDTLKIFRRFDFHIFSCVSTKNFTAGYDPVDQEMNNVIKELIDVADSHVVVSGDHDFDPLLSWIRQRGKEAYRIHNNEDKSFFVLFINKDKKIAIPYKRKMN